MDSDSFQSEQVLALEFGVRLNTIAAHSDQINKVGKLNKLINEDQKQRHSFLIAFTL